MASEAQYKVLSNTRLTSGNGHTPDLSVWKMVLAGPTASITAPGQFVNIVVPGKFLRRPISICCYDSETITIVYRIVGGGTLDLSTLEPGSTVQMLTGLGNGFATDGCAQPLLVGGGVGLPPMLGLARQFKAMGLSPVAVGGFNSASDVILQKEFEEAGIPLHITTMDGSLGTKGTVMEVVNGLGFDKFFACGPKPMLKALAALPQPGLLSVEERMGCGFGVCMGCTCQTTNGIKRVCKDGPVFDKEVIKW